MNRNCKIINKQVYIAVKILFSYYNIMDLKHTYMHRLTNTD